MIIDAVDGYRFKSDAHGWAVEKRSMRTSKKTGEEYEDWVAVGYTGTVAGCARLLTKYLVRTDEETYDLKGAVAKIQAFHDAVQAIIPDAPKKPEKKVPPSNVHTLPTIPEKKEAPKKKRAPRKSKRAPRKVKR